MTGRHEAITQPELIGREGETGRLRALIENLPDRGGVLALSGEAGIGKSALLDHAAMHTREPWGCARWSASNDGSTAGAVKIEAARRATRR